MPNGIISEEQFKGMKDTNLKLDILFGTSIKTQKTLEDNIKKTNERFEAEEKRFNKIEKKALSAQIKDKGFSGMMGVLGGFLAGWFKT